MESITSSGSTTVTPKYSRLRRRLVLVGLVLLAVVALVVVLVVRSLGGDGDGGDAAAPSVPGAQLPEVGDPAPVLASLAGGAPAPDPAALDAALSPLLAVPALGAAPAARIVDVATGEVLLDRSGDRPAVPASTAKLLTAVAALTALDPDDTLATTVVAGSVPGEVVLVGAGDPTLSTTVPSQTYPGAPTVADLAGQVRAALGGTPVTGVVVDNGMFSGPLTAPGWGPGDAPSSYAAPVTATAVDGARIAPGNPQRSGAPGTDAGRALAAALGVPAATVGLGEAPEGARVLGTVRSAPIGRLVEQMLAQSDNLLAEALARHVALARGLPATFDGVAQAVPAALEEAGFDVDGVLLADGSGLSAADRVPAALLARVLVAAAEGSTADLSAIVSGLAVAGYDGTLADRGDDDPATAPGAVRGKTGTLQGVHALAGTVVTADGRLLVYAFLADGVSTGAQPAEDALDEAAAALAACGCP
ncbi:D-alanyl-D-alanine carboxypeptidase/D-alanyl-D-alanine endopeptidase [Trujillonella endophytica]|uniref:D-alanyl-D-alanine carboxypeptidase / D-alanyl-D-alanine-endopeptidase (Penicillin-binding protein 4) n=1 Tax=Trujillonella endophytica TaxID=673521 RepID=A0A1H8UZR7_9ACTN|nr:D-alanyl-D-alanine carboxypeptidase/D-alanyl-D-alanine-endopeptidase [Trujillella endophytica]SEP08641.1 D-alanyl-D-alanine carboxypeptidase / D-alanyl-D-alanine-endopeptidase (penicillin-binding protein 4) [Trujillella endophytica]